MAGSFSLWLFAVTVCISTPALTNLLLYKKSGRIVTLISGDFGVRNLLR
jgi:hypothetical protein